MRRHLRGFTVLFLIAGLLAWEAAPASARPGRLILHRHAIPGQYILVLGSAVPRALGLVAPTAQEIEPAPERGPVLSYRASQNGAT
jgi:hypothetical protein